MERPRSARIPFRSACGRLFSQDRITSGGMGAPEVVKRFTNEKVDLRDPRKREHRLVDGRHQVDEDGPLPLQEVQDLRSDWRSDTPRRYPPRAWKRNACQLAM